MKEIITILHDAGFRKVPEQECYRHIYEKGKAVYMHLHTDGWELCDSEANTLDSATFKHRPITDAEICYLMNEYSQENKAIETV